MCLHELRACVFRQVLQHNNCYKEELNYFDYILKNLNMQAGPPPQKKFSSFHWENRGSSCIQI